MPIFKNKRKMKESPGIQLPEPAIQKDHTDLEHIKVLQTSADSIKEDFIKNLWFNEKPPAMILGYVSPDNNFSNISEKINSYMAPETKLILCTTSGELCSNIGGSSIYIEADENRKNIVLQSFSRELISGIHTVKIPLFSEDIRTGSPKLKVKERINHITKELLKTTLPFKINHEDTIAFTLIDGLSNSENFFMEAVYDSAAFPCLFVGGSAGGSLDFRNTYIFHDGNVYENHALVSFIKLEEGMKFGVLKSQNFEKTGKSYMIMESDITTRYVKTIFNVEKRNQFKSYRRAL